MGPFAKAGSISIAFLVVSAIILDIMVIRMRHTRAHTANRRSHHALKAPVLALCANCEAPHRPHHMCLQCGFYKGRQVMDLKAQKDKRTARMQAKKDAISAQAPSEAESASKEVAATETK